MDDLKLYGKDETQIDSLVKSVYTFSTDIGMEFGLTKCGVIILKRGKVVKLGGIVLPTGEVMKTIDDEGYKYLGILELDEIMEERMKDKFMNEYYRRLRLVLKSKLNGSNKFQAINTWAVSLLRYGAGAMTWRRHELQGMDRKTRKLLTMYGAFHPKGDVDRLYLPRAMGGRGLISCEGCVTSEENNLGWYIKRSTESLLVQVRNSKIVDAASSVDKTEYKRNKLNAGEQRWKNKKMYGQFCRDVNSKTDKDKRWAWLKKGGLKPETEALICAAQEQALRANYIKHKIDHTREDDKCRMCGQKGETVAHNQ